MLTKLKNWILGRNTTKGDIMGQSNWVKVMFVDMTPVGSFQIFGVCTHQEAANNSDLKGKIFWTDYLAGQPIGPFNNVYEATQNHVNTVLSRRAYKDQILLGNNPIFPQAPTTMKDVTPKNNITSIVEWKVKKGRKV